MKVYLTNSGCTVIKEKGDPSFRARGYGGTPIAQASRIFYHVKNTLNKRGYDLIKKRMVGDKPFFHMTDDLNQYVRTRKASSKTPHIYIYDNSYMVRDAGKELDKTGYVDFSLGTNIFNLQPNTNELLNQLESVNDAELIEWANKNTFDKKFESPLTPEDRNNIVYYRTIYPIKGKLYA